MLKEKEVRRLFEEESIFIKNKDVIPDYAVKRLFGEKAYDFAKNDRKHITGYGIGHFTMWGLTYEGFQIAATFYNVEKISMIKKGGNTNG